jgi:transposase
MADAHMPDAFFNLVRHLLPPEPTIGPRGGRPTIRHPIALKVIWFVLVSGCRWEDVPAELGCSGRTAHRRLQAWEEAGCWDRIHLELLRLLRVVHQLDTHLAIVDSVQVRALGGGDKTGPSPVDRGKKGSKHTLLVDRHGVPLAIRTAGSNASDHTQIIPVVLQFPRVGGQPGRPKELPEVVMADAGYDSEATRALLRWLGVEPKIRKSRAEHGSGLGKVRWVVERTISWLKGLRRLRIRYDRKGVIVDAWTSLAASVICFRLWYNHTAYAG